MNIEDLRKIPGLEDLKFYDAMCPAFLGRDLEAHCCAAKFFATEAELVKAMLETQGPRKDLYILSVDHDADATNVYMVRYVCVAYKNANPITDIVVDDVKVSPDTFVPQKDVSGKLDLQKIQDLAAAHGMDEVARQVGEAILSQVGGLAYEWRVD